MSKRASAFQVKFMAMKYRGKEVFKPLNTGVIDEHVKCLREYIICMTDRACNREDNPMASDTKDRILILSGCEPLPAAATSDASERTSPG